MLDIKYVIENIAAVTAALQKRGAAISLDAVLQFNDQRKALQHEFDELRALQNQKSKEIAQLKKEKRDAQPVIDEMQNVALRVKALSAQQTELEESLKPLLLSLPNLPDTSVPVGTGPEHNQVVRTWGDIPQFSFKPREHWEIGESLGLLDFERAAKMSGARFALYRGALARLERSLIQFMLDVQTRDHGYEEILPPFLVNAEALTGTGQLPKFEEDLFKTTSGHYLIPTAEVPLTNIHREEVLPLKDLPKRFCAYTPCFRSEAGSYGKDMKGLIRQHQFNKVELVKIVKPENSFDELEAMVRDAEKILQLLKIPYRVVLLCTGDMGFSSVKTYDIEVFLPGQNAYREISSCSNCGDFQARRMSTRFKDANGKLHFVHTLNGSGLAVGRTLIAVLENYQQADGSVKIPEVLQSSMGCEKI